MRNLEENDGCLKIGVFVALATAYGACNAVYQRGTVDELSCVTIERVENVIQGDNNSKYLVFTEDHGVLENTDSLFHWKFNSSDFHGTLADGGNFDMTTYGWRIPFFSMYPNIVEATPNPNCED